MGASDSVTTQRSTLHEWTQALAESKGFPGGGAAAGVMLSIAASLTSMVAGYTEPAEHHREDLADIRSRAQALAEEALQLADDDAAASEAFGAAFRKQAGPERQRAIEEASVFAAEASAALGTKAIAAIDDLEWLAVNGKSALIADVAVALGALRAAMVGARTNVSFDLHTLTSAGNTLQQIEKDHPRLWNTVTRLNTALDRVDDIVHGIDHRAAPTDTAVTPSDPERH
ncbi:cyclodeaminase/cyclohydrolase family protein [Nesterenkonia rhizosphaerae]|uniref:Cyclodeaminase/cyclohydrolase domain-containing protein n=1 Tax=Nesterenkonia rhizosphaerae TaxID=1348272 RepID=A0ABP9FYF0_9MICC